MGRLGAEDSSRAFRPRLIGLRRSPRA